LEHFTPFSALLGGGLIGLSAGLLLVTTGRITGISGIVAGMLVRASDGRVWRGLFVAGLILGCGLVRLVSADALPITIAASSAELLVAGLLVGFGTRLANGCTSGHGICGVARLSPRSILATLTFIASGAITVFMMRHVFGA
jgi:uncharacterized membrane protein YedE/YeeE